MNRREGLSLMAGSAASLVCSELPAAAESVRSGRLGLVLYARRFQREFRKKQNPGFDLYEPMNFLQHCRDLNSGGMQARLGVRDAAYIAKLRAYAEKHSLFIDAIVSPPRDKRDLMRFESEIKTAKEAGVLAVRTVVMPGRRYERFGGMDEFRKYQTRAYAMVELAAPIVEKHRIPLAIENHKDQRNDERIALFEHISSEYVGATVDTGNSFALLEDPIGTIESLAPWAHTVHLKDQALMDYKDGFLLGDIALGDGAFDLQQFVRILRAAKPDIQFVLELITRDALEVPCFTERYWATLPNVPGSDLARTMRIVRSNAAASLVNVSGKSLDEQVRQEDSNVTRSLAYAREQLNL